MRARLFDPPKNPRPRLSLFSKVGVGNKFRVRIRVKSPLGFGKPITHSFKKIF